MRGRAKKLYAAIALALAAMMVASTAAIAAVTYDLAAGGFAGKGDVQTVLGMNNKQIQSASLSFTYTDTAEYDVPCIKETTRQTLRNSFDRESTVNYTVQPDPRIKNQITGFNLAPAQVQSAEGNVACPGGWEADGEPVLVSTSGGQLFVNGVPLPITPAA